MIVVSKLSWKCELGAHTEAKCVWSSSSCLLPSYKIGLSQGIKGAWGWGDNGGGLERTQECILVAGVERLPKSVKSSVFMIKDILSSFNLGKTGNFQARQFSTMWESRGQTWYNLSGYKKQGLYARKEPILNLCFSLN